MSCSSKCWAVDLPLIPLSAMSVLLNIKSESCSDMIFDLALGFFFMVSYHLRDTIYKYSA